MTTTVYDAVPALVGVPLIAPVELSESPTGSDSEANAHVLGAELPVTERLAE